MDDEKIISSCLRDNKRGKSFFFVYKLEKQQQQKERRKRSPLLYFC
jgi:hypothetical protein